MIVSFLFWNINGKPLQDRLARLALAKDVDVLMLAECETEPDQVLDALNGSAEREYCLPPSEGSRIRVFTRLPESSLIDVFNSPLDRLTIRRLRVDGRPEVLLSVLHFQSRANWAQADQTLEATTIARDIARAEERVFHRRTILVGDMNMNPFDPGLVGAQALNAVMTGKLAEMVDRTVAGRSYRCFYNPMWGFFGDRTPGPAGTFFHHSSAPATQYWHMFDQVLLRPELVDRLQHVEILDTDGEHPLVMKHSGRPSRATSSDHLPIFFQLDL
ncbi:MAG: endonuclease/exonuclease/phosphatase family protein [Planctomycetes bacterium]|nr:endonuclease/exonuclease/phosphatase family protein [Planctomycetota bacterium]